MRVGSGRAVTSSRACSGLPRTLLHEVAPGQSGESDKILEVEEALSDLLGLVARRAPVPDRGRAAPWCTQNGTLSSRQRRPLAEMRSPHSTQGEITRRGQARQMTAASEVP